MLSTWRESRGARGVWGVLLLEREGVVAGVS